MGLVSRPGRARKVLTTTVAAAAVIVASFFVGITVANAAETSAVATSNRATQIRSDKAQRSFTSTSWTDVPGTHMTVGAYKSNIVIARFGAQSICEGSNGWCAVRIMIAPPNGSFSEAHPADGKNFVWQWAGSAWGQTMIERHRPYVIPASNATQYWSVKVQVALQNGATRFRLQDWTLAVEIIATP